MKRLFAVFALCATTLFAASAISSPAAADRHDTRRHAGPSDRQTSSYSANRGEHQRGFRDNRDRRHLKFRRHKRHRHAHRQIHRYNPRFGYGYSRPSYRHGYRRGSAYGFSFDGGRFIFRLD